MRASTILGISLIPLALPFLALADGHDHQQARRHHALANRRSGDVQLHKRFDNARFTFFADGLGACGQTSQPGDFIVALNTPQYGSGSPGPQCFKQISITANGKTTTATIMDECPGCPYGGLDMSTGLFTFFAPESVGVLTGSWTFLDGSDPAPAPAPAPTTTKEKPSPTPTPTPTPTSTWSPPPTTSSTSHTPTTTSTTPSSTSTWSSSSSSSSSSSKISTSSTPTSTVIATSSVDLSSGAASGLAVETGVLAPAATGTPQNLNQLNLGVIGLGAIIAGGARQ